MKNTESIKFGDTVPLNNIPFGSARRLAVVLLGKFLIQKAIKISERNFYRGYSLYVVSKLSESLHSTHYYMYYPKSKCI